MLFAFTPPPQAEKSNSWTDPDCLLSPHSKAHITRRTCFSHIQMFFIKQTHTKGHIKPQIDVERTKKRKADEVGRHTAHG